VVNSKSIKEVPNNGFGAVGHYRGYYGSEVARVLVTSNKRWNENRVDKGSPEELRKEEETTNGLFLAMFEPELMCKCRLMKDKMNSPTLPRPFRSKETYQSSDAEGGRFRYVCEGWNC